MSKLLVIIGGVLVGVGIYWYLKQQNKSQDVSNESGDNGESQVKEESPMDKNAYSLENIILAEETFALGNLVSTTLNESLGTACDKLIKVLPVMNDDFPNAEVTFKLNEMADKIIPAKVSSFVNMDRESQNSRLEEFKADMVKLITMIERADEVVRQTNLSKDERETLLIGIKY